MGHSLHARLSRFAPLRRTICGFVWTNRDPPVAAPTVSCRRSVVWVLLSLANGTRSNPYHSLGDWCRFGQIVRRGARPRIPDPEASRDNRTHRAPGFVFSRPALERERSCVAFAGRPSGKGRPFASGLSRVVRTQDLCGPACVGGRAWGACRDAVFNAIWTLSREKRSSLVTCGQQHLRPRPASTHPALRSAERG